MSELSLCEIRPLWLLSVTFLVTFPVEVAFGEGHFLDILGEKNAFEDGLDPAQYFRLKNRQQKKRKRRRKITG